MFCPSCGATNSPDQRFCRGCGMNLELVAQSLLEQFPAASHANLEGRERRLEKFGQVAFGGFIFVLVVAVLGMIYAVLDRMVFSGNNPMVGILLMAFMVFAMLSLLYVIFREDLKEKRKKITSEPRNREFEDRAVTAKLIEER